MKRKYTSLIVINPLKVGDKVDQAIAQIAEIFKSQGAEVAEAINLGRKKFAYDTRKFDFGAYCQIVFSAEPEKLQQISKSINAEEIVVMYQLFRAS